MCNSRCRRGSHRFLGMVAMLFIVVFYLSLCSVTGGELSYSGQVPRDFSVIQMSKPGTSEESVSLYTGQHTESLPLFSLPAGSLGAVTVGLTYSGNVSQQASLLNDEAQAGWVGLGFDLSLTQMSILCDHKGTVNLYDDEYFITGVGSEPLRLIDSGSFYYPANEAKLRAERQTMVVLGKTYVSGWTIWAQDGTVYQLGDSLAGCNPTTRSATAYELHWDEHVGVGVSDGDRLIPTQWHLRLIQKGTSTHIQYVYTQETEHIQVYNSPHSLSECEYTRDLYLHKIMTSAGYEAEFFVSSREDFLATGGPAVISRYRKVKLDSVVVRYGSNSLSRIQLSHDYLRPQSDSTLKKLLLVSVTSIGSDTTAILPATEFDYDLEPQSPGFGAIASITYPEGGVKRLSYRYVDEDEVITTRNGMSNRSYASTPHYALSRDVLITKFRLHGETFSRYEVSAWNGFWDTRTLEGITDPVPDSAIAAGEGWAVLYNRNISSPSGVPNCGGFIYLQWSGGVWVQDTIRTSWAASDSSSIMIVPGGDCFVVLNTESQGMDADTKVQWAYLYKREDAAVEGGWSEHLICDFGSFNNQHILQDIQVGLDSYAIDIRNKTDDKYKLHYGRYNHAGDSLEIDTTQSNTTRILVAIGQNFMAYGGEHDGGCVILDYSGVTTATYQKNFGTGEGLKILVSLADGIAARTQTKCITYMRTVDSIADWTSLSYSLGNWDGFKDNLLSTGANSFVATGMNGGNQRIEYFEWNGLGWTRDTLWNDQPQKIRTSENVVVFWDCATNVLRAARKTGFGEFGPVQTLESSIRWYPESECLKKMPTLSIARDIVAVCGDDLQYNPERWAFLWNQSSSSWDTINLNPYTDTLHEYVDVAAFRGRLFAEVTNEDYSMFQLYKGSILGKPQLAVVDTVVLYPEGAATDHPIATSYSYGGGILDASVNTPRFARATVSSPYFASDGDTAFVAYNTSYFFNDLDDNHFDEPDLFLPDLEAQDTYGRRNGGYALDGLAYLSFSDTTLPGDTTYLDTICYYCSSPVPPPGNGCFRWRETTCPSPDDSTVVIAIPVGKDLDQSRSYYSMRLRRYTWSMPPITYLNSYVLPRALVDSVYSQSDETARTVRHSYDTHDRRIRSVTETASGLLAVDSVTYCDYEEYPPSGNTERQMSYLLNPVTLATQWLSHDSTLWMSRSQPKSKWLWPDANPTSSEDPFSTFALLENLPNMGVDSFDNVVSWQDTRGDTSSVKYSPDGARIIAVIGNGLPSSAFVFDAEYDFDQNGVGYDGWEDISAGDGSIVDSISFTGSRAYVLHADKGLTPTPGVRRTISADSLKGTAYVLSFWAKSAYPTYAMTPIVIHGEYAGGDYCYYNEISAQGVTDGWKKCEVLLQFDGCSTHDSVSVTLGAKSTNMAFDDIRLFPVGLPVATSTYDPSSGRLCANAGSDNVPTMREYDALGRLWRTRNHAGLLLSENEYFYSRSVGSGTYDVNHPNYIKTTTHRDADSTVTIGYSDGLGRTLQTRTTVSVGDSVRTVVSDAATRNARQQGLLSYKPYVDLVGSRGLEDYTLPENIPSEANSYYDGINAADCGGNPHSEQLYKREAKTRVAESASPGIEHATGSGHTVGYDYSIVTTPQGDTLDVTTVTDEDGIVTESRAEHRGAFTSQVGYYSKSGQPATVMVTTFSDPMAQSSETEIDTAGSQPISLRRSYDNDLGLADSTWKVDYGTIRMIYDRSGNIRFMKNDKRLAEHNFVYFKYDVQGRKIEEGVLFDSSGVYFSQDSALNRSFPNASHPCEVAYRWFYDYLVRGSETLCAPGKLVRVENADTSYYRKFYYFPEELSDSTVVKLPFSSGGTRKAIVHRYNRDGSLKELVVHPKLTDTTKSRGFRYTYDVAGRLRYITRRDPVPKDSLRFGEFEYKAEGGVSKAKIGVYGAHSGIYYDTLLQQLEYAYDPLGQLVAIADTADVIARTSGIGVSKPHFAQALFRCDEDSGYYNGRIASTGSVNSYYTRKVYNYNYTYDDRGWLTHALRNNDSTNANSQRFAYNALGQRKQLITGASTTTNYVYDASTPGSSRLRWFTGMGTDSMKYDGLGNLVKDSSRKLDTLKYDYRNLLNYNYMEGFAGFHDILRCQYDEGGQRVKKLYHYWYGQYYQQCPYVEDSTMEGEAGGEQMMMSPGGGEMMMESTGGGMMMMQQPPEPEPDPDPGGDPPDPPAFCPTAGHSEKLYLYDGGVLLATFDGSDNVIDLYVDGPTGRLATYYQNNSNQLYYYLNDHLGSARVLVNKTGQTQYYVYYPFGQLFDAYGTHGTEFQFTGKEHDAHGSNFSFDYFGARYYDSRVGSFTTVDKAGQFASGYVYGANDPLIGTDPDGNLFFMLGAPFISGFLSGAFFSYVQQDMAHRPISGWKLLGNAFASGMGSYIGSFGRPDKLGVSIRQSVYSSLASNTMNNIVDNPGKSNLWFKGSGYATLTGAAQGVLTSEHFGNLLTEGSFRSNDSYARMLVDQGQYVKAQKYINKKLHLGFSEENMKGYDDRRRNVQSTSRLTRDWTIGGDQCDEQGLCKKNLFAIAASHEYDHYTALLGTNDDALANIAGTLYYYHSEEARKLLELHAYAHELAMANRIPMNPDIYSNILNGQLPALIDAYPLMSLTDNFNKAFRRPFTFWPAVTQGFFIVY